MDEITNKTKERMEKSLAALHHELSKVRTGRASLSILDDVTVDYYGQNMPINQLANLGIPDPRTISIQPWDASSVPLIEKAIQKADLGLNPVVDGKVIRLPIPALTEERRMDIVKGIKRHAEESKIAIRNIRRDANDELKVKKKDGDITEDDEKQGHEEIQKLTDEYVKKIDESTVHKEKDIMEV